ncbi:MAG: GNAT family N-acetyltransferase [Chloroflexota bacterium]
MDEQFEQLMTPRLVIRRFAPSDAEALAAYRSDPEIARYQSWTPPYRREQAIDFIAWLAGQHPDTPGEWYQFAIATRERPEELIGDLACCPDADDPATVRIGFTMRREAQGKGYATEAVRALLGYLFEARGKHRVAADCDPRNAGSRALLERVGFRREGELIEAYPEADGTRSNSLLYGLLAREWRGLQG